MAASPKAGKDGGPTGSKVSKASSKDTDEPVLMDGRRPAVWQPTEAELQATTQRYQTQGVHDSGQEAGAMSMTFVRVNPFKKAGLDSMKEEGWAADGTNSFLLGPAGPSFIGKVFRQSISGKIKLQHYDATNQYDFHAVDLWTRPSVEGLLEKLKKDKYLFRAIPMLYRTWLYHEAHRQQKHPETSDETGQIRRVLSATCIDANISGGRWSPMVFMIPASFFAACTNDELTAVIGVFGVWFMQRSGMNYNNPESYRELRFWLLLPRIAWLLFAVIRSIFWLPSANPINVVGLIGIIACIVMDIWFGDKEVIAGYKFNCHYEVVKVLPKRVFICRRKGAADTETMFGHRGRVHYNICGMGTWKSDMLLIAEIMGCIFELRPFNDADWTGLMQEIGQEGNEEARMMFWGIDCFDKKMPDWDTYERKMQVEAATLQSKASQRPGVEAVDPDVLLEQLKTTQELLEIDKIAKSEAAGDGDEPPEDSVTARIKAGQKPPLLS
jgi:hypothetical protein